MSTPEDVKAAAAAAAEAEQQKDHARAAALWQQCLRAAPDHRDRRYWMASHAAALFDNGRPRRAFAVLRRLGRLFPDRPDGPANLALLYQRAGAHDLAAPLWRDVIARFPDHRDRRWWLSSAAYSSIDLGCIAEAQQLAEAAVAEFPQSSGGYHALAATWERRLAWQRACGTIDLAMERCSAEQRPDFIVARSHSLAEMGAITACERLLQDLLERFPGNLRLLRAAADLATAQGPTEEALRRWRQCHALCPDAPESWIGLAGQLRAVGDGDGARALLRAAAGRFPRHAGVHQALAEACAAQRDMAAARRAWEDAERLAPLSIYRLWAQCAFLGACGARGEAEALLARRRAKGTVLWRGRYEYAKSARELDEALACLAELRNAAPGNASLVLSEAEILSWRQADGDLRRAAALLRSLLLQAPEAVRVRALLTRVLVLLDDAGGAEQQLAAIPGEDQRRSVGAARLWRDARHGDWAGAQARWQATAARFFQPALHLPQAELRLASSRFVPPAAGGILAVSIMRNELPRLPGFLDHHRRLGVDGFVIVDNGSQDGTAEYLAEQPDVRLYDTRESFAQSCFGMRWLNQVIDMHGRGWVLYADADERLVFPGSETRSLVQLTEHLAACGAGVMGAVMLDMFPVDGEGDWFDPPVLRPSPDCPYLEASGGVRRRLFGTTVTLTKAPLVNAAAGVRYLGSHHTTPAPPSPVTAAMLHHHLGYLFDPEQVSRMAEEVARAEHSDHAVDRRRMLAMAECLPAAGLRGPQSLRYTGTAQLLQLGLIRTSAAFAAATAG